MYAFVNVDNYHGRPISVCLHTMTIQKISIPHLLSGINREASEGGVEEDGRKEDEKT